MTMSLPPDLETDVKYSISSQGPHVTLGNHGFCALGASGQLRRQVMRQA